VSRAGAGCFAGNGNSFRMSLMGQSGLGGFFADFVTFFGASH
jgi:hypothetical protein